MEFDIRTLVIILGVTHLMQVLVFYHQYRLNQTYRGIGWWLLWSAAEVVGFAAILLRNIPSILPLAIVIQNIMIIAGTVSLYIGIRHFLGKPANLKIVIPVLITFLLGFLYFLFIDDEIEIRSVLFSLTLATIAFLTAKSLITDRPHPIRTAANFNALIFLVHGGIFLYRAVMILFGTHLESTFTPSLFNILPYFDALIVSLAWTFGLIIMLNQRLYIDMVDAKEDLQLIFNTSPDAALITSMEDGRIVDINDGFTALTGYTREDVQGRSTIEINFWKYNIDRQRVLSLLKSQGYCENIEAQFVLKNGIEITGLMSAKIIGIQGVPNIISITRDITRRNQIEKELHESDSRFHLMFENMAEGVALHEMIYNNSGIPVDYRILDVNSAFERFTNISAAAACGALASELYGAASPPYLADYVKVLNNGIPFSFETHFDEMDQDFSISVVRTKPDCFATIFLDITERKRHAAELARLLETAERSRDNLLSILEDQILMQEALSKSEQKFREIISNLDEGYYHVTLDGTILDHNQAFNRIFGSEPDVDLKGQRITDFWQRPEERAKYVKELIGSGTITNYLIDAKKQTGEHIVMLTNAHLLVNDDKRPVGIEGVLIDISVRIRNEHEIKRLNEDLEQRVAQRTIQLESVNKELEAFSYSVSHDLRAPLRHISGFVELLSGRFSQDLPEKAQHYLTNISDSIGQMGMLIDDLLKFSRTGRMEVDKKEQDMQIIFDGVLEEVKFANPNRVIKWRISNLPIVNCDFLLMQMLWNNLLSNAVKFTRNKEIATITVKATEGKNDITFSISDNGVGFDMQYAQKLFGVFQRLHPTSEFEGTGIGLANVHRIVMRHGGRIWANAKPDQGASFYFTLPKNRKDI